MRFKASLVYIMSSRTAWITRETLPRKKEEKKKKKRKPWEIAHTCVKVYVGGRRLMLDVFFLFSTYFFEICLNVMTRELQRPSCLHFSSTRHLGAQYHLALWSPKDLKTNRPSQLPSPHFFVLDSLALSSSSQMDEAEQWAVCSSDDIAAPKPRASQGYTRYLALSYAVRYPKAQNDVCLDEKLCECVPLSL